MFKIKKLMFFILVIVPLFSASFFDCKALDDTPKKDEDYLSSSEEEQDNKNGGQKQPTYESLHSQELDALINAEDSLDSTVVQDTGKRVWTCWDYVSGFGGGVGASFFGLSGVSMGRFSLNVVANTWLPEGTAGYYLGIIGVNVPFCVAGFRGAFQYVRDLQGVKIISSVKDSIASGCTLIGKKCKKLSRCCRGDVEEEEDDSYPNSSKPVNAQKDQQAKKSSQSYCEFLNDRTARGSYIHSMIYHPVIKGIYGATYCGVGFLTLFYAYSHGYGGLAFGLGLTFGSGYTIINWPIVADYTPEDHPFVGLPQGWQRFVHKIDELIRLLKKGETTEPIRHFHQNWEGILARKGNILYFREGEGDTSANYTPELQQSNEGLWFWLRLRNGKVQKFSPEALLLENNDVNSFWDNNKTLKSKFLQDNDTILQAIRTKGHTSKKGDFSPAVLEMIDQVLQNCIESVEDPSRGAPYTRWWWYHYGSAKISSGISTVLEAPFFCTMAMNTEGWLRKGFLNWSKFHELASYLSMAPRALAPYFSCALTTIASPFLGLASFGASSSVQNFFHFLMNPACASVRHAVGLIILVPTAGVISYLIFAHPQYFFEGRETLHAWSNVSTFRTFCQKFFSISFATKPFTKGFLFVKKHLQGGFHDIVELCRPSGGKWGKDQRIRIELEDNLEKLKRVIIRETNTGIQYFNNERFTYSSSEQQFLIGEKENLRGSMGRNNHNNNNNNQNESNNNNPNDEIFI